MGVACSLTPVIRVKPLSELELKLESVLVSEGDWAFAVMARSQTA